MQNQELIMTNKDHTCLVFFLRYFLSPAHSAFEIGLILSSFSATSYSCSIKGARFKQDPLPVQTQNG